MPETGDWATIRDHLVERLPRVAPERIDLLLREQRIVDLHGPIAPDAPFVPGGAIWFHRDLPEEVPVPFDIPIVHRDDDLLVVDKPHFLATIPRGKHIVQTALVRLRQELDLPTLVPAHRLDRATAGLVLFVINPALRGAYQTLFMKRAGAQGIRGDRPARSRAGTADRGAQPDRQGTRRDHRAGGRRARSTPRPRSS